MNGRKAGESGLWPRRVLLLKDKGIFIQSILAPRGLALVLIRDSRRGAMSETRKLAAILLADIVGYSRLAGADEDRILARAFAPCGAT